MVGQTAIVNRLLWMQDHYPLIADDVVAQKTPCSFDVSVWEFWWPFIAGAQLVMAEPEPIAIRRRCSSSLPATA
jgi:enterobactin synthetase component F